MSSKSNVRTLRSKKLRAALYAAHDGRCAICGESLPDNWHADHIKPWVISQRTNIHEMQPLCPKCNLEKGTKMLRKHQAEMCQIAADIAKGAPITDVIVQVTPGGGKSSLAAILAAELAEKTGRHICVIVPRDALRAQGEKSFNEKPMRRLFGHTSQIRAAGNDWRPARESIGYITTYQAIAANPQLHIDEFERAQHEGKPYILILDECHHVPFKDAEGEEAAYYAAIEPLINLACLRIYASGTLERHDGYKIAFLPYKRIIGSEVVDFDPRKGWLFIRYSRKDALEEGAVVPLHMQVMDGAAQWLDPLTGEIKQVPSLATSSPRNEPAALKTVLETEYAYSLLDRCLESWLQYRAVYYSRAKMLVVAPGIAVANEYCRYLATRHHKTLIATSDDTPLARANIKLFRGGRGVTPSQEVDILVTVGMAYEGLDVPQISHVACLTNIRSRPWIEQAICRANRTDAENGKTHGFIFYPDDPRMAKIVDAIYQEQAGLVPFLPEHEPRQRSGETPMVRAGIAPLVSELLRERGQGLEDGTRVDYNEYAAIETAMAQANIRGVSVIQFKQAIVAMGVAVVPNSYAPPNFDENILTPSELEGKLKETVDRSIKRIAQGDATKTIELNQELKMRFGPRAQAGVKTLQMMLRYLRDMYGEVL